MIFGTFHFICDGESDGEIDGAFECALECALCDEGGNFVACDIGLQTFVSPMTLMGSGGYSVVFVTRDTCDLTSSPGFVALLPARERGFGDCQKKEAVIGTRM